MQVSSFINDQKIPTKWPQNFSKSESRDIGIGGKGVIASFLSVPLFMVRVIIFFAKVISFVLLALSSTYLCAAGICIEGGVFRSEVMHTKGTKTFLFDVIIISFSILFDKIIMTRNRMRVAIQSVYVTKILALQRWSKIDFPPEFQTRQMHSFPIIQPAREARGPEGPAR